MSAAPRDVIDAPVAVRPGEALDLDALARFLREHSLGGSGEVVVQQFPRGFSNLTYLVRRGSAEYILRRPPFGVGKGVAHDVVREAGVLSALGAVYHKVPRILAVCRDEAVLGAPFYLMERALGIILRDRIPAGVASAPDDMRRLSEAAIDTLAEIHAVDYTAAGLGALGTPVGYVERQLAGWIKRCEAASTGPQPDLLRIAHWLSDSRPADSGAALIHNDFKYDNLVLDPANTASILAVLDWEMATIGDPLMDLGTSLAYWVEGTDPPAMQALGIGVTALPGNLSRRGVLARYEAATGKVVPHPVYYYAFGLFKVAVIAQQIYARFVKGFTKDPRFAHLDRAVAAIGAAAVQAVDQDRLGA